MLNFRAAGFRDASFTPMTCQNIGSDWEIQCAQRFLDMTIYDIHSPCGDTKFGKMILKKNSCFLGGCRFFFTERPATYGSSEVTTDTTIDAAALGETRGVSRISHLKSMEKNYIASLSRLQLHHYIITGWWLPFVTHVFGMRFIIRRISINRITVHLSIAFHLLWAISILLASQ